MHGIDILRLSVGLTTEQVSMMAHALGWPSPGTMQRGRGIGRPKWARPYRNGYSITSAHPAWEAAVEQGLATRHDRSDIGAGQVYSVTPLGQCVMRLRLRAARMSRTFRVEEVSNG